MLREATEDLNYLNSLPELSLEFTVPIPWAERDTITLAIVVTVVGIVLLVRHRRKKSKDRSH